MGVTGLLNLTELTLVTPLATRSFLLFMLTSAHYSACYSNTESSRTFCISFTALC